MKYVMKERWFSFGNDFDITDEHGTKQFHVDGRALSIGEKLSFQDTAGHELAFIRQRLLAWGPTYEVLRDGKIVAVLRKKIFTLFRCKFEVDLPGPNDLEAKGDFFDHEYEFLLHEQPVAQVSKKWISWTDTYAIEVNPPQDPVMILAYAVIIDLICHEEQKH
jgi:uncharacterized protein YxjI